MVTNTSNPLPVCNPRMTSFIRRVLETQGLDPKLVNSPRLHSGLVAHMADFGRPDALSYEEARTAVAEFVAATPATPGSTRSLVDLQVMAAKEARIAADLAGAKAPNEKTLNAAQFARAIELLRANPERFGLPKKEDGDLVFASWNIRKLGGVEKKTAGSWRLMTEIIRLTRPDLLNIQETQDETGGLEHILRSLGPTYDYMCTDATGGDNRFWANDAADNRGSVGMKERLVTVYDTSTVRPGRLASDMSFDRSAIEANIDGAFDRNPEVWVAAMAAHGKAVEAWKKAGADSKKKPKLKLPADFIDFTRTPSVFQFQVKDVGGEPRNVLVVNEHMVYGDYDQRSEELEAFFRSVLRYADEGHDVLIGGDFNLKFRAERAEKDRARIVDRMQATGRAQLEQKGVHLYMPFLDEHPTKGVITTNLRSQVAFDQIGFVGKKLAATDHSAFDYGAVLIDELLAETVYEKPFAQLSKEQVAALYRLIEHDVTDHKPIWVRYTAPVPETAQAS